MSCPDWKSLSRQREAGRNDAPEWRSALEHLEDCDACQATAPAFDPTLLFQSLPVLEADTGGIESMKQAVASMRRGETLERRRRRVLPHVWLRAAAVAAVLLGSLLLRGAESAPEVAAPPAGVAARAAAAAAEIDLRYLPLVEITDPSYGSIIQVVDDDISVVLVVPSEMGV